MFFLQSVLTNLLQCWFLAGVQASTAHISERCGGVVVARRAEVN